jgi:PKD repeat protein
VTNSFGSQEKTVPAYVSAGVLPAANFLGSPKNGYAPLTVQFTDLSTGIPSGWNWDFGDGSSSASQNPAHTYVSSGTYGVSLTVSNSFGSNSRIATGYITVTPQPRHDLYLTGSRNAYLEPGGYLQCIITRDDAWIKLAGTIIRFRPGDTVQLIVMDPSSGRIDATATAIDAVDFNDVKLFVNSKFVAEGTVSSTGITGYQGLRSQITLVSPPEDSDAILYADGGKITRRPGQSVIIRNLVTDSDGNLDFSKIFDEVYFKGGAESYQVV